MCYCLKIILWYFERSPMPNCDVNIVQNNGQAKSCRLKSGQDGTWVHSLLSSSCSSICITLVGLTHKWPGVILHDNPRVPQKLQSDPNGWIPWGTVGVYVARPLECRIPLSDVQGKDAGPQRTGQHWWGQVACILCCYSCGKDSVLQCIQLLLWQVHFQSKTINLPLLKWQMVRIVTSVFSRSIRGKTNNWHSKFFLVLKNTGKKMEIVQRL